MKGTVMISCLLLALLSTSVTSQEQYELVEKKFQKSKLKAPARVKANKCFCLLDDGLNSICLDDTISVKAGWEFTQEYSIYNGVPASGTGTVSQYYYKLRAQPYISVDAVIHPYLIIDKLYTNEITADLDSFKAYVFGELLYFQDHSICLNAGWATDKILFTLQMAMSFRDCYKTVINTLFNFDNWVGPSAKWIDSCDKSNDEDLTLYSWNPITAAKVNQYWFGDGTLKTSGCFPGNLFKDSFGGQALNNLIVYVFAQFMNFEKVEE